MEITFNYLGKMQQLERDDSILQQVDFNRDDQDEKATADVGPNTNRLGLFEISAIAVDGKLKFTLLYNRNMLKSYEACRWFGQCKDSLEVMTSLLSRTPSEPTLSDYPLMPLSYDGLRKLTRNVLPKSGVQHLSQVEDIYPCSPIQEGLLISQLRDPHNYICYSIFQAKHVNPTVHLNARKIGLAWQKVVDRHAALRTFFIDSVYRGGMFDQVVMKNVDSGVLYIHCDDADAKARLSQISIHDNNHKKQPKLPHQLTVCTTTSGRIIVKAEINHVVIDGGSIGTLLDDLAAAYEGKLAIGPGPLYSDYIRFIRSQPAGSDTKFWTTYLRGVQPCYFPKLSGKTGEKCLASVKMNFTRFGELQELAERSKLTLANIIHTAWALILRKYTKSDDVCFGYLSAGRDAPVENIHRTVGAFINMLCCRVQISPSTTLEDLSRSTQEEYLESIPFQRCSLARVQHDLGLAGKPLYNTSLSIQNHSSASDKQESNIIFDLEDGHDPSEVSYFPYSS
jgi:non-ribosomal peptide synthase protein (TIGR01720 family)